MPHTTYLLPPTSSTSPLHRLGRWLLYLGLLLAGGTGYACGVSCTRAQPPHPEPLGQLVLAPAAATVPAPHCA